MTSFVTDQPTTYEWGAIIPQYRLYQNILKYAQFLKQPLALWMFVPCDENNVPLEKPKICDKPCSPSDWSETGRCKDCRLEVGKYEQAKSRVIFEGFYKEFNAVMSPQGGYLDVEGLKHKTIETIIRADLTLTETAIKQIYGS